MKQLFKQKYGFYDGPYYFSYTTPWSEGVVVARNDDTQFAVGYDPISGGVMYSKKLSEFAEVIDVFISMKEAVEKDTAFYQRYPFDPEEGAEYQKELHTLLTKIA